MPCYLCRLELCEALFSAVLQVVLFPIVFTYLCVEPQVVAIEAALVASSFKRLLCIVTCMLTNKDSNCEITQFNYCCVTFH